jgi:hypothetical protein
MKTTIFKAIALGMLVWLSFAPTQAKAQVVNPYMVTNDLLCSVTIRWSVYTFNLMTGACDVVCDFGTITIPPGPPPTFIPWNAACAGCKVRISIINIGGTPIIPALTASFPPPPGPTVMGPAPAGCSPSGNVLMDVFPHATHIHP